jgi:hypothetical protein
MFYDLQTGHNPRNCHVILRTPGVVAQAMEELQDTPVFDVKVRLEATSEHPSGQIEDYSQQVDPICGWHASKSPDPKQAKIRQPSTTYPTDLFAPLDAKHCGSGVARAEACEITATSDET